MGADLRPDRDDRRETERLAAVARGARPALTLTDLAPIRGGGIKTADGFISAQPTPDGRVHVLINRSGGDAGIFLTPAQARDLGRILVGGA